MLDWVANFKVGDALLWFYAFEFWSQVYHYEILSAQNWKILDNYRFLNNICYCEYGLSNLSLLGKFMIQDYWSRPILTWYIIKFYSFYFVKKFDYMFARNRSKHRHMMVLNYVIGSPKPDSKVVLYWTQLNKTKR